MKNDDSLYIKVLLWAYEKRHVGFTKEEMKSELSISDKEWLWVDWVFFNGLNGDSPLIWYIPENKTADGSQTDYHKFFLTTSGTAATIDYLELKEAQEAGKRAEKIALVAIAIGAVVGIAQILAQIFS